MPNPSPRQRSFSFWDIELGDPNGQVVVGGSKVIVWCKAKVEDTGHIFEDINATNGPPVSEKPV